jgi:CheY-like chemotaxis protein
MDEPCGEAMPTPEPYSILVVEDETLVRMMIADDLRDAGFKTIEAGNADDALKVLHAAVTVDMVVTDIRMPGSLDGLELARRIRADWPNLKIVIVSSEDYSTLAGAPTDAVFGKPYRPTELIDRINQLLGKQDDQP